jgi:hypothetical protein
MRRSALLALATIATLLPTTAAVAAEASADRSAHVRTVTYPGHGAVVTLDHLDRIPGTSSAFRTFVERRLTRLWHNNDARPECRTAATMIVKRWRSDGFALVSDMGNFAPCPGGGWVQVAVREEGHWRTPVRLGAQEPYRCSVLASFDVPVAIVPDGACYAGEQLVSYRDWRADH